MKGLLGGQFEGQPMLTPLAVRRLSKPGKYAVGAHGLAVHVVSEHRKNWILRFMLNGRERTMGLGSAILVSLPEAMEKALAARKQLAQGIDPIEQRRVEREAAQEAARVQQATSTTFAEAASRYIAAHEAGWRNAKHRQQWRNTLAVYAEPVIGHLPVGAVTTEHVLAVLNPIWRSKTSTAGRVRNRIELVLDYAAGHGWRSGPNPATWRGNLRALLPAAAKLRPIVHHAALDWQAAPSFLADLRAREDVAAQALEFLILTATRLGEVRGASWDEIDVERAIWLIPADRMKAKREHRVPLSAPALAILTARAEQCGTNKLVFARNSYGAPLAALALDRVLQRMGRNQLTVHGFRSTFSDWAHETTHYPNLVVEQALAHTVGSQVERAYRRGDLFTRRQALMGDWADFLTCRSGVVVPLRTARP
jgi:integrase